MTAKWLVVALSTMTGCANCNEGDSDSSSTSRPSTTATATVPSADKTTITDDEISLSRTDEVDVAAALMDFTSVDPTKTDLERARLWLIRRSPWGWDGLLGIAAKVAREEPRAAFWLKVEHHGEDAAILASIDGHLAIMKPDALKDPLSRRMVRSSAEAERVMKVLAPVRGEDASDTALSAGEREVVENKLVMPLWPDTETLRNGELVDGSPFEDFRIEGNRYLPERLVNEILDLSIKLNGSMSAVMQKAYIRARDRIQKTRSSSELPKPPFAPTTKRLTDKKSVFLIMPSWMALEVERKAAELDCSQSTVITAAVVWGLPDVAREK